MAAQILKRISPTGKSALDLGCGSGPTAHFLHDLGFETYGIDVSPTAISMANALAREAGKDIHFLQGDITQLTESGLKLDLIYDSHCLHCIVLERDRHQTFVEIRNSLRPGGVFVLDTMIFREGSTIDQVKKAVSPLRFDQDYILWHETKDPQQTGVVELDGKRWCPQRRIYPAGVLANELKEAGFTAIEPMVIPEPKEFCDSFLAFCRVG